jgi:hypothetical protein
MPVCGPWSVAPSGGVGWGRARPFFGRSRVARLRLELPAATWQSRVSGVAGTTGASPFTTLRSVRASVIPVIAPRVAVRGQPWMNTQQTLNTNPTVLSRRSRVWAKTLLPTPGKEQGPLASLRLAGLPAILPAAPCSIHWCVAELIAEWPVGAASIDQKWRWLVRLLVLLCFARWVSAFAMAGCLGWLFSLPWLPAHGRGPRGIVQDGVDTSKSIVCSMH